MASLTGQCPGRGSSWNFASSANRKENDPKMDDKYAAPREQFFAAVRALATSSDSIQARLLEATTSISSVTLDQFDGDLELRIKLARILDDIGPDRDDIERIAVEITPYMTEDEAERVADLIVDFFDELVEARSQRSDTGSL
ncbi:hypothetical protein Rleg4DRAFT_6030 [Rhizobium leguminosarum bv. trifolii WSM2297]|uniref:Uncharacterized protein n=1 Tax=Rhizobium leguminosarum bv. trifolii WSM2297 TaxID=754762 RepID=J0CKJ3_RHILT|nr:hypothetical protein [Rhizobium leguminosarum]EJC84227.1 hypothetical protein Rleg4DRAFT_6030 [Rhizobium leguminosarum bv. trifolii WSM2297]